MQIEARFRQNLRLLRHRADLTQRELAEKLGLKRSVITSYEGGKSSPSLKSLLLLTDFFEITMDELLFQELTKDNTLASPRLEQQLSALQKQYEQLEIECLRREIAYRAEIVRLKEAQP